MSHVCIKGNRWYTTFRLYGRQHHFSLRVPASMSRRQILRLQQKIDYELAIGTFDPKVLKGKIGSETTLYNFLDQLKDYYKKHKGKFSPRILDDYLYSIVLLKRIITDLPFSRFTHEVADGEVMSYLYEKYSHTSVRHRAGNFRSFFSYAVKWKYLEENP